MDGHAHDSTPKPKRSHSQFERSQRPKARLYVAGCNAWNNLIDRGKLPAGREPQDIMGFQLADEGDSISRLRAFLSWTFYVIDGRLKSIGDAPCPFDRRFAVRSVQDGAGHVLRVSLRDPGVIEVWTSLLHLREHFVLDCDGSYGQTPDHCFYMYPQRSDGRSCSAIREIAAWETGFIMMDVDRRVYTMGDPRFPACLGRPLRADDGLSDDVASDDKTFDDGAPPMQPIIVTSLPDPIDKTKKIVAGGYAVGVLTEHRHLYVWGMNPGTSSMLQAIPDLQELPNYEPVGDDEEIEDVAFGLAHAVALTENREVFVRGHNRNGQLGLGWNDRSKRAREWTKVELDLGDYQVEEVFAGPRSSFLIARLPDEESEEEEHQEPQPRVTRSRAKEPQTKEPQEETSTEDED